MLTRAEWTPEVSLSRIFYLLSKTVSSVRTPSILCYIALNYRVPLYHCSSFVHFSVNGYSSSCASMQFVSCLCFVFVLNVITSVCTVLCL
jgi:hypothetical protein